MEDQRYQALKAHTEEMLNLADEEIAQVQKKALVASGLLGKPDTGPVIQPFPGDHSVD